MEKDKSRVVGLDIMRIAMALIVFMFHSRIHVLNCSYGILNSFVEMGAIAMTGFFILSGYVLNLTYGGKDMSCFEEIKHFYKKRLISIMPLYFVWAFFLVVVNMIINGEKAVIEEGILFPIELLGIQSVFSSLFFFSHNDGSWFISCILICYFFFPLLHIITKPLSDRKKVVLIFLLTTILLWSPFVQHYFTLESIYSNPFFRGLEFTIGILVSQLNISSSPNNIISFLRKPIVCILSFLGLILGVTIARRINIPADYMLYSWVALPCFMSLTVSLGSYKFKGLQNNSAIKYLSELAFCIFLGQINYVWYVVKDALELVSCQANIIKIFVSFMTVFCIANLLHYFVEVPSSKYLKRKCMR